MERISAQASSFAHQRQGFEVVQERLRGGAGGLGNVARSVGVKIVARKRAKTSEEFLFLGIQFLVTHVHCCLDSARGSITVLERLEPVAFFLDHLRAGVHTPGFMFA